MNMCDILIQKQPCAVTKGTAKHNRINQTSLFNMTGKNED